MICLENHENILIAQRPLYIDYGYCKVKGIPDLLVFRKDQAPRIIDWKVHHTGLKTYQDQLMVYALALSQSQQKGFPKDHLSYSPLDYELSEYQLLINEHRKYFVTEEALDETDAILNEGIYQLHLAGGNVKNDQLILEDFEIAQNLDVCQTCPYHKICSHEN